MSTEVQLETNTSISQNDTTQTNGLLTSTNLQQESHSNSSTAAQSPQLKQEELTTSNRNTPVPQSLQFQIPNGMKPSEVIGGAPVRKWLNEKVTPSLIEGMRKISKERPQDPLKVLGEYLIQKSENK